MAPPDDQAETVVDAAPGLWRIRWIAAVAFTLVALVATARADKINENAEGERSPAGDPRAALIRQLAEEQASVDAALATVTGKLAEVDLARGRRLRAAYRLLRAAPQDDRMATARRRAAAAALIQADLAERTILADETTQLRTAASRTTGDAARVADVALPTQLGRPVRGTIARRFGTLQHDRSKATLSRRGLDFEVEARAVVSAPAEGIVRYAGPIRGLDAGVIIDHGTYLTVIAKLGEPGVPVGARVSRGDRIGRAARHRVYLEVRVKLGPGGHPIDPEPYLEKRAQPR